MASNKQPDYTLKLRNGTKVSDIMVLIDVDFIYSVRDTGEHILMNKDMFGVTPDDIIEAHKEHYKTVIIHQDGVADIYNIPYEEFVEAMFDSGNSL